jgi:hypothetical protein
MIKIILLDVDGVLVHPAGYRAALRATINHLTGRAFTIPEGVLAELEKRGISSEWDMAPLVIATCWNEILSRQTIPNLPADVISAARVINRQPQEALPGSLSVPMFPLLPDRYPAESAFEAGCFASLPYTLRKNLLTGTRDITKSHTLRIFQHFALGSLKYSETYNLPPELETESFLSLYDTPAINGPFRAQLSQPNHYLVGFTSRPSGPPKEIAKSLPGFAPEAELALELTGLPNIPVIAFGKLEYLARQYSLDPASLVKPSAFHSLAAILAAWTGEEWASLQAARRWHETGMANELTRDLPEVFDLIVIEDTLGGVRSTRAAAEVLMRAGLQVNVHVIGLTSGSTTKASGFRQEGIPSFEGWESVMEVVCA